MGVGGLFLLPTSPRDERGFWSLVLILIGSDALRRFQTQFCCCVEEDPFTLCEGCRQREMLKLVSPQVVTCCVNWCALRNAQRGC